jgi:hypothetical protein
MTDRDEKIEAIQYVVEDVTAAWDGVTLETVEDRLVDGLRAAGLEVEEADVHSLVSAIEETHGTVTVSSILPG